MKIKERAISYKTKPQKFTYQDYIRLPDDGNRYEVINGELIMVAAPNTYHQSVSGNLEFALRSFIVNNKIGKIFDAPVDVVLSENNVVQPDILFITKENYHIITEKNISGAPDLVIEILSEGTAYRDLIDKKELYAQFGVKEYWIVDPIKQRVEVFENRNSDFELTQQLKETGKAKSKVLNGFEVNLTEIFNQD